jgi:acyl carrier protein
MDELGNSIPQMIKAGETVRAQKSYSQIEGWLVASIAAYAKMDADDIDISLPFADFNLDSSVSISLTCELASWLGIELAPTSLWEYPNIQSLAGALAVER